MRYMCADIVCMLVCMLVCGGSLICQRVLKQLHCICFYNDTPCLIACCNEHSYIEKGLPWFLLSFSFLNYWLSSKTFGYLILRGPSGRKMMVLTKITENLFLGWGFSHTHYLYVSHLFSTYLSYFSRYEYLYEHIYTLHLCSNIVFWRIIRIFSIQIENNCVHSIFSY